MQAFTASSRWKPPVGTLGELTSAAHRRAGDVLAGLSELRAAASHQAPALPFAASLRTRNIAVIAEVKRASPSKGAIALGLDAVRQAERYVEGGATAISVLTEPDRFAGALADLAAVAARVAVPVIRKDFLVHPVQLWEARAAGASAALLIVRALSPDALRQMIETADLIAIEVLVEVRDEAELERALECGARVIGVNNRDLETLVIDPLTAPRIIPHVPVTCIAVAESGMSRPEDVSASARVGADAILVGSAISRAADPIAAVRQLAQIPRRSRGA